MKNKFKKAQRNLLFLTTTLLLSAVLLLFNNCSNSVFRTPQSVGSSTNSNLSVQQKCSNPDYPNEVSRALNDKDIYSYYTKESGQTLEECEASRVITSVCQASSGLLVPPPSTTRFKTCKVQVQVQTCIDPENPQKFVNAGTTYSYNTLASGTEAQCASDKLAHTSTCDSATGLFKPALPPITQRVRCVVVNPVTVSITSSPATIILNQKYKLTWTSSGASQIILNPGQINVTDLAEYTLSPTGTTTYTLTAQNSSGESATSSVKVTLNVSTPPPSGASVIWAIGACGHVEKSTDNGATFQGVNQITTKAGRTLVLQNFVSCGDPNHGGPSFYGMDYGNGRLIITTWNIGIALGPATTNEIRLFSDDKGNTWQEMPPSGVLGNMFMDLSFNKTEKIFIGSNHYGYHRLIKSNDGVNWQPLISGCESDPICKFRNSASSEKYFIVGGDGGNFFKGNIDDSAFNNAQFSRSQSYPGDSRRSISLTQFGVLGGTDSNWIAVVEGRTGFSSAINLGRTAFAYFEMNDELYIQSNDGIYRVQLSCAGANNCSAQQSKVASANIIMNRAWSLNGYLYGAIGPTIYRSQSPFILGQSSSVQFVKANTNVTNPHGYSYIKKMVYIP